MTKFDELQQAHQNLLDRADEVTDKAAFVHDAQAYVAQVRDAAVEVSNSRDRDQLRANLRYWASYIYDATGTYPATTLRPSRILPPPPPPPDDNTHSPSAVWILLAVVAVVAVLALVAALRTTGTPTSGRPVDDNSALKVTSVATSGQPSASAAPLEIKAFLLTQGPSPFDSQVWVAKILLAADGGNDQYVYWIDGQRYPGDEYTREASGCESVTIRVGVTSDGQSARGEITILSPLANCGR